eukprot:5308538-Pyramimonas_sp.AAC.1
MATFCATKSGCATLVLAGWVISRSRALKCSSAWCLRVRTVVWASCGGSYCGALLAFPAAATCAVFIAFDALKATAFLEALRCGLYMGTDGFM